MNDFLGQPLAVGDYVLYTQSHVNLKAGRLVRINPKTIRIVELKGRTLVEKNGKYNNAIRYSSEVVKMSEEQLTQFQR